MSGLRVWLARCREIFRRGRLEADLDEELRHHLDLAAAEYERRGLAPEEARRAARRDFGGVDQVREAVADRRGFRLFETLARDTRRAVRLLRATPGFTAAVIVTLGLGIGVNTAIFSIVNAALLRPLPWPDPDRLVAVWETATRPAESGAAAEPPQRIAVAPANLTDYRRQLGSLVTLAGYTSTARTLTGAGTPERLTGEAVMPGYHDVLGARPILGRVFVGEEFVEGRDASVILSEALWRTRWNASPDVVGRRIRLDDRLHEIVGVLPASFRAVSTSETGEGAAFYVPLVYPADMMTGRGEHLIRVVGRLRGDATVDAVRDGLASVAAGIAASEPLAQGLGVDIDLLADDQRAEVDTPLVALLAGVGLVLLAACANVSSLLIVRSLSRRREVAVRVALGATRGRVMLELAVQSLVLAGAGGLVGLALGVWTTGVLASLAPSGITNVGDISVDWRTLAFTGAMSLATALLFGLLPAWHASRARGLDAIQPGGRATASVWVTRARGALLFAEVAVSVLLLVGAGLMVRSLQTLNAVDLGFDPDDVLAANVALTGERYGAPESRLAFFEDVAARLARRPGIDSVAFANRLPLRGNWTSGLLIEPVDNTAGEPAMQQAGFQAVSPGYFPTLGIEPIAGRLFTDADGAGAQAVAVVSAAFGRDLLGGGDPIGRRFQRFPGAPWVTIVGVVDDLRRGGREADILPQVYLPAAQVELYPLRLAELAVRTAGASGPAGAAIHEAVWAVDPNLPVTRVSTLNDALALQQAERRFQALLFLLFAVLTLTLAVVGIYSVVSYVVAERRQEICVRLALGATMGRILRWVAGQTAMPVVAGAAAGLAAAWWLSRFMTSLLFGIEATDPVTYVSAAVLLATVGITSALLASQRARRIAPAEVLR